MPTNKSAIDEEWVKAKVKAILKEYKVYYFMPMAGRFGKKGVPDFICCCDGVFLGIETKANGNTLKPTQIQQIRKIKEAKGIAIKIDENNYHKLPELLKRIYARKKQCPTNVGEQSATDSGRPT